MSQKIELNPPSTPMCQEYSRLFWQWVACAPEMVKTRLDWAAKIDDHRTTCPVCQKRHEEFNELARNAKEPEVSDER